MQLLIWGGAVVVMLGLAGLMYCAAQSLKAKHLPEAAARAVMQKVVVWNLAAMGVSVLGLMTVVMGLVLR